MVRKLVSVIVVNWNGKEHLEDCFLSLVEQSYTPLELLLVDNASVDGSVEYVRERFPGVRVLVNPENRGFGAAVNRGVDHARGDYILFLNNDLVLDRGCVEKMVEMMNGEKVGAVVPKILYFHEKHLINSFGVLVNYLGLACPACINEESNRAGLVVQETACGGIFLMEKAFFRELGGFDSDLFMYHEDHDLSWRIRLSGKKLLVTPFAIMYHKYHFGRNSKKFYYSEKNRLQLLLKHYQLKTLLLILPALVVVEIAEMLFALSTGWLLLKLRSYREIATLLPSLISKRRKIQEARKVSDREIIRLFQGKLRISGIQHPLLDKGLSPLLNLYWNLIRHYV